MKHLAYVLFVTLFLAGCSKDNTTHKPLPEEGIGFSDGVLTRGTPIANAEGILSMGVFCGLTDGNFTTSSLPNNYMDNVAVSRTNSSTPFTYSPLKYWPTETGKKLSFFAYAPHSSTLSEGTLAFTTSNGTPSLTYTIPSDVTQQPDLMVATPKTDLTKAAGQIGFDMRHALTCIGFKVAGDGYKVIGIKIVGAAKSGTLKIDGSNPVWSPLTATGDFAAGIRFDNGKNYYTTTLTMSDFIQTNGYLMMIPQTPGAGAKIVMSFEGKNDLEFPLNGTTWTTAQKMVYNITIKARPEFVVTIEEWKAGYDSNVQTDPVTEPTIGIGEWVTGANDQIDY